MNKVGSVLHIKLSPASTQFLYPSSSYQYWLSVDISEKMPVLTKEVRNDSEEDDSRSISSDSSYDFEENEMYMEMKDDENSQDENLERQDEILLSKHHNDEDFDHLSSTEKLSAASTCSNTDHMFASPTAILETETVDAQLKITPDLDHEVDAQLKITSDLDHEAKNQTQAEKKQNLSGCKDVGSIKKMKQNPSELKRKQTNQDDLQCPYCGKWWRCRSRLLEHLPVHTGEKNFSCSRCGKKFIWRSTFRNHKCTNSNKKAKGTLMTEIKKKESLAKARLKGCTCKTCGNHFSTLSSLKKHALTHKKRIDFKKPGSQCKLCRKHFTSKYHLFRHALTHSKSKLYTCERCQKKFSRKNNLARHQRKDCFGRKNRKNISALYSEKVPQPSSMQQTGEKRNKSSRYGNALLGVQPMNNTRNHKTSLKRTVADLTCSYCGKVWPDITKLHDHLSVHTGCKNFRCSKCGLKFKWRNSAKSHAKKCGGEVIRKVNKFKNKSFKSKRQNITVSKFCHKAKKNSVELKTHLRFHTTEKKQPHLLTHTNIKPLSCMWCLMRFKSSEALAKHVKQFCPERKLYNSKKVKKIVSEKADTDLGSSNELNAKTDDIVYFSCSCGKTFKFRKSLQVHKTKCQGKSSENSDSKPTQESKSESCGSDNKDSHVMPMNRREVEESSDNSSIIKDLGNVVLKKDINRKQIMNTKEQRKHPCPLCQKLFTRKDTVEKHLKIHFGVSHFKCKYCNMKFKSFYTLNNHKVEAHSNIVDNRPDQTQESEQQKLDQ